MIPGLPIVYGLIWIFIGLVWWDIRFVIIGIMAAVFWTGVHGAFCVLVERIICYQKEHD